MGFFSSGSRVDPRRRPANNPNLHDRQFGEVQPRPGRRPGRPSSGASAPQPPTLPVGNPMGTSQRVIDAWAQKRRKAAEGNG